MPTIPDHAQIYTNTHAEWQIPLECLLSLRCWLHTFHQAEYVYVCDSIHSQKSGALFHFKKRDHKHVMCIQYLHSFPFYTHLLFSYFSFLLLESILLLFYPSYYCSAFSIAVSNHLHVSGIHLYSRFSLFRHIRLKQMLCKMDRETRRDSQRQTGRKRKRDRGSNELCAKHRMDAIGKMTGRAWKKYWNP